MQMLDFEPVPPSRPGRAGSSRDRPRSRGVRRARGVRFALDAAWRRSARDLEMGDHLIAAPTRSGSGSAATRSRRARPAWCASTSHHGGSPEQLRARGSDRRHRPGTGIRLSLTPCNLTRRVDSVLAELRRPRLSGQERPPARRFRVGGRGFRATGRRTRSAFERPHPGLEARGSGRERGLQPPRDSCRRVAAAVGARVGTTFALRIPDLPDRHNRSRR